MKKALQILVGMIVVIFLMALVLKTSRKDTVIHFTELHEGMTKQEVANVMGLPAANSAIGGPSDVHAPLWNYNAGTVEFTGDKVQKITPRKP